MEKSISIKNIAAALMLFHVKVGKVNKDSENPFFKSKYASLGNILDVITDPLIESGLTFSQLPVGDNGLITLLMHCESGEYLQAEYNMRPVKDDPQGRGSCITYQKRYALASVLGLNIDEDDDGNAASKGEGKKENNQQQPSTNNQLEKPWLNKTNKDGSLTEMWNKVVKSLVDGTRTITAIETAFKISKENKTELLNITKN